jgi:hypothetical protein
MVTKEKEAKEIGTLNKDRRNLLKILIFGGGAYVATKLLGPVVTRFLDGPSVTKEFDSFRTVENKRGVTIFDKNGEEIFIMDNKKE